MLFLRSVFPLPSSPPQQATFHSRPSSPPDNYQTSLPTPTKPELKYKSPRSIAIAPNTILILYPTVQHSIFSLTPHASLSHRPLPLSTDVLREYSICLALPSIITAAHRQLNVLRRTQRTSQAQRLSRGRTKTQGWRTGKGGFNDSGRFRGWGSGNGRRSL